MSFFITCDPFVIRCFPTLSFSLQHSSLLWCVGYLSYAVPIVFLLLFCANTSICFVASVWYLTFRAFATLIFSFLLQISLSLYSKCKICPGHNSCVRSVPDFLISFVVRRDPFMILCFLHCLLFFNAPPSSSFFVISTSVVPSNFLLSFCSSVSSPLLLRLSYTFPVELLQL